MRDNVRSWARRAAGGLAAAGLLFTGLQLAGSAPAAADTCWVDGQGNVHCTWDGGTTRGGADDDGGYGGGGGGFGGGGSHQPIQGDPDNPLPDLPEGDGLQVLSFAVASLVDVKLTGPCLDLITGSNPAFGDNAKTVFQRVEIVSEMYPAGSPNAAAAGTYNMGRFGTLSIYPAFEVWGTNGDHINRFIPANTTLSRNPDRAELQAFHVLHELAHLTGKLSGDDPDHQSGAFNLQLLSTCFGITKTN
jgi:hypothetical protein